MLETAMALSTEMTQRKTFLFTKLQLRKIIQKNTYAVSVMKKTLNLMSSKDKRV